MYLFYIDGTQLPVAPSKVTTKIKNQNKTINLINETEANVLKLPGMSEISFDALLPNVKYPFASYPDGFHKSDYYTSKLENLKNGLRPFPFDIIYQKKDGTVLFPKDSVNVSLEDYTITQDASQGTDITVSITLKQYNDYGTQVVSFTNDSKTKATSTVQRASSKQIPKTYTVKRGDSLWKIAKLQLNNGSKWSYLAKKNSISSPYKIHPGMVLKL